MSKSVEGIEVKIVGINPLLPPSIEFDARETFHGPRVLRCAITTNIREIVEIRLNGKNGKTLPWYRPKGDSVAKRLGLTYIQLCDLRGSMEYQSAVMSLDLSIKYKNRLMGFPPGQHIKYIDRYANSIEENIEHRLLKQQLAKSVLLLLQRTELDENSIKEHLGLSDAELLMVMETDIHEQIPVY